MKHKLSTCDFPSPFKLRRLDGGCSRVHHKESSINSLLDLSARVVAEHLPFEYVERMLVHIPEPVQDKIIYYSFPQRDSDIYTYASFHSKTDKTRDKIPYYQGLEYFQNNCVEDVIQIGFHLTGSVRQQPATCISETEGNKFKVSITFDRCKIISVCCDCGNKGLSWCPHVVALALFRIRQPHLVDYRSPISDALVRMNRSQLQKFAQYLIASHPNKILPSAQQLADQLLQPESNINKTSGAPDPTAGGSLQDVAAWYLDEAGVREQLRVELTNLASNGLYGFNHHNMNNLRLSSSGRCSSPNSLSNLNSTGQQAQQNNNTSRSSSSFLQRSNSSHRSHANSSSSLGVDSGMGNQNDIDFNCSTEVGLEWLLRYRRLTLSQNLLVGGSGSGVNSCTNPYILNGLDFAFSNFIPMSMDPNIHSQPSTVSNNANNNTNHSNNRLYCSTTASSPSPFHWSNSIDTIDASLHHCDTQSNGTQIAAMFAKVRELLAKRDSNGPRLLSLITEELLSCSKLPLVKSRRNQRNTTIDVSNRIQTIATPRISHGQQQLSSSDRQYSHETLASSFNSVNNGYNHNSLSSSFNQSPPWTVRLWEEVCLLWTCVVLSPDCSVEAKRQWRYRFLTWARASRCPRDESYSIPSHFFTSIHESSDVDDDGSNVGQNQPVQSQQQSSCPQMNRPYKRASVFRLPIEVSYMSWDDVWWNHLLSIHDMKLDKHEEHGEEVNGQNRQHSTNVSLDDTSSDCSKVFRRPSSITPRRSIGFNRSFQLNSTSKECQCPYCDHSSPLNEPFPLLCLRVAALRSNGYLSQALQLAVFISQRLLRSVKMKTSLAAASVMNSAATTRSPPQTFSNIPWNNNNCHPSDIVARRMLFNTLPNGQALRASGMSPHNVMHNSTSRYLSSFNMPPSPSMISNHGKFSPSSRLTSPRPASLSPPVNVNHSRSVSTRRHGLSPNSNPSPGPSCTNHQSMIINNNNNNNSNCSSNNNSINNNCWSNQSSYVYKSPSSCQQYVNHSPHCSPIPPASSISPIPFHNPYQPTATNHHPYHSKHIPHPNSPYSYPCPPPPPPHAVGSSVGCPNSGMMMQHPSHHNRSLTSPTPINRSVGTRPLPSSYSTNGSVFSGDYFPVTEMDINCGLISTNCPSHAEIGWIGLPGRPILCLVECLLDAAAIVVEAANHQAPIALPSWGHMEKASFYLCLAVKVSLLSLFQQRRLVGSVSRLLACQHQETRLLTLLSTIPKDVTTALTMCEILCQLLGPPISTSSSRLLNKSDHSTHINLWWWSSLGIVVHSDTYPVHAVAEFVLNYLLDTQKLNQLISFNTCWSHPPSSNVGGSNTNTANNISSIRIDDMVFTLVTRAMRFSILENYFMDNSSIMGTHLTRSNSSPQLLLSNNNSNINQNCLHSQRTNYNHRGWGDYFDNPCSINSGNIETALAVNTEVSSSDQEFGLPSSSTTGSIESSQFTGGIMHDSHQRYLHPSNYCTSNNSCRWDLSQQHQQSLPDYDHRCMLSMPPSISVPPLPSIFSMSTQNCLKFNHNATTSGGYLNPLCNNNNPPTYHPMLNLQNLDSSRFTSPTVTGTTSPTVGLPSTTTTPPTPTANNILSLNQNPQYRRCLETLKLRQTRLAVALIRVSKSHIHRLDQIVQICDQNIHSAVSLLAISQQVFAEAVGWKLRSPVNRKPSNSNLLDSVYSECGCLLNPNPPPSLILPTITNPAIESLYTRDRIYLISTAFHLALIVVLRTLSRSVHWRRREMLAWAVSTALHVGPPACLYLIYHWSSYVNPREAVSWLAPALLTAVNTFDTNTPPTAIPRMSKSLSSSKICSTDQPNSSTMDNPMCYDHSSLFFGHSSWDDDTSNSMMMNMNGASDVNYPVWPSSWYSFCPTSFTSRSHSHSIIMAAQLLSTSVPYSKGAREQIANAVRHMALQAAAKDPINCALPALNLSVKDPTAFDAVYRLILNSAESGSLGPIQLFSLARYMDNCGWTWRAFPFALHATRLFVLSTTQESHPIGNDVLWACLLGHRLGSGALQEILNHVIRNIHCPTLLTDILHRCRSIPCGMNFNPTNVNCNNNNNNNSINNGININTNTTDPSSTMNNMTNSIPVGRGNSCTTHYCNPTSNYINNNNNTGISIGTTGKMLSLDRPPLKGLLDAAINGYVMATHMRLANISPRQYAEFVDFLTRARDTFHLLRPDGPLQFRSLVECLRQTYRGKRKLVSLLAERFG